MKLILCKNCLDVISLIQSEERSCSCGKCSGQYTDQLNAWYKGGDYVVPLGFNNKSLVEAINSQPKEGMGKDFSAFVIPEKCETFIKLD